MTDERWMQSADLAWIRHEMLIKNPHGYPDALRRHTRRLLDHIDAQAEHIATLEEFRNSTTDVVNTHLDVLEMFEADNLSLTHQLDSMSQALETADKLAEAVEQFKFEVQLHKVDSTWQALDWRALDTSFYRYLRRQIDADMTGNNDE